MRAAAVVNDIRRQYRNEADQLESKEKFDNELAEMIRQRFKSFRGLNNEEQRQYRVIERLQKKLKSNEMMGDGLKEKYDLTEEQIQMLKESTHTDFVPPERWQEVMAQIFEKYRNHHLRDSQMQKVGSDGDENSLQSSTAKILDRSQSENPPVVQQEQKKMFFGVFGLDKSSEHSQNQIEERENEEVKPQAMDKLVGKFQLNAIGGKRRFSAVLRDGQFVVGKHIIDQECKRSLYLFTSKSTLRRLMVQLINQSWFNYFIMFVIFFNCIIICMYDHSEEQKRQNEVIEAIQNWLTIIYVLEAIIKIIADGFVFDKGTYLRNPVNCFDFIIVIASIARWSVGNISNKRAISFFRILRTLRVFKLLAGFQKVPQLKKQIVTLGHALKGLANVAVFLLFFFILLAIFGLQLFSEDIYNACRETPEPVMGDDGKRFWKRASFSFSDCGTGSAMCTKKDGWLNKGGFKCPNNYTCGSYLDYNLPLEEDGVNNQYDLNFNIATFKNIGTSLLSVFQIVTQDNWSMNLYNLISVTGFMFSSLFMFAIHMMGSYFLMNLMLAVIMHEYIESEKRYNEEAAAEEQRKIEKLRIKQANLGIFNQIAEAKQIVESNNSVSISLLSTIRIKEQSQDNRLMSIGDLSPSQSSNRDVSGYMEADPEKHGSKAIIAEGETQPLVQPNSQPFMIDSISFRNKEQERQGSHRSKESSAKNNINSTKDQKPQSNHNRSKTVPTQNMFQQLMLKGQPDQPHTQQTKIEPNQQNQVLRDEKISSKRNSEKSQNDGKEVPPQAMPNQKSSLLLGRLKLGVINRVTEKQKELQRMQEKVDAVKDENLKALLQGVMTKVQTAAEDKNEENLDQRKKFFKQIEQTEAIHQEQQMILQDLERQTKEKARQEKFAGDYGFSKQRKEISSFLHQTLVPEALKQDVQDIAMNLKQQLNQQMAQTLKGNQTQSKAKENQSRLIALQSAQAKKLFGEQNKFLKKDILQQRAQDNYVLEKCLQIDQSKAFQFFLSLCIIGNTILLTFDRFPQSAEMDLDLEFINFIFYLIFFCEMIIKLLANGFRFYFKNTYNRFDFIVVLISTLDLGLSNSSGQFGLGVIRALRIFRLLRVFKLAKVWKSFSYLIETVVVTIKKLIYMLFLVLLFWFTYTIIGKELYAYKLSFSYKDGSALSDDFDFTTHRFKEGYSPDYNFNTFLDSTIATFLIIASGGWSSVFYLAMRSPDVSQFISSVYFLSLRICGKNILFQLFLAILLNEFDERSIISKAEIEDKGKEEGTYLQQLKACCKKLGRKAVGKERMANNQSCCLKLLKKDQAPEVESDSDSFIDVPPPASPPSEEGITDQQGGQKGRKRRKNNSLFCFSRQNPIRRFCRWLTAEKEDQIGLLDKFIMIVIAVCIIQLAFEGPLVNPAGKLQKVLNYIEYVTSAIFLVEAIIKIIAVGFLFNGRKSYLRQSANMLDFFVVLMSILTIFSSANLGFFKLIRMAKLARPIKLVFRNEKLKISVLSLIRGLPQIFNLLVLLILVYTIFGIIFVNFFKGKLYDCDVSKVTPHFDTSFVNITDIYDCENYGGTWYLLGQNFNTFVMSLSQMFIVASNLTPDTFMQQAIQTKGTFLAQKLHPPFGIGLYNGYFFIGWMLFGGYFFQNLFVGVVISEYNRQSEQLGKNFLLTEKQKSWIETKLLLINAKPKRLYPVPTNPIRKAFWRFTQSEDYFTEEEEWHICGKNVPDMFDAFIMITIIVNTIILCVKWPYMDEKVLLTVDIINYVCTGIFIFEAFIKITALGRNYFRDRWNIFDFIIVIGSLAFISPNFKKQKNLITIIRAFRVGRVFKLFSKLKQLQGIFQTFLATLPALANVGMLMLLIIYIFAIVGVEYFGQLKLNPPLTRLQNFQTLPKAFIALFVVVTGDNWNNLWVAMTLKNSVQNECINSPTYEDYVNNNYQTVGCGYPIGASIYLFCFVFIMTIIFVNLFVAIILQGYFSQIQKSEDHDMRNHVERFREQWARLDPEATGKLDVVSIKKLMFKIGKELGWSENKLHQFDWQEKQIIALSQNMKEYEESGLFSFSETLDNLIQIMIIKQQIKKEMLTQGIKIADESHSEDISGVNESIIENERRHLEEAYNVKGAQLVKDLAKKTSYKKTRINGMPSSENRSAPTMNRSILEKSANDLSDGLRLVVQKDVDSQNRLSMLIQGCMLLEKSKDESGQISQLQEEENHCELPVDSNPQTSPASVPTLQPPVTGFSQFYRVETSHRESSIAPSLEIINDLAANPRDNSSSLEPPGSETYSFQQVSEQPIEDNGKRQASSSVQYESD